MTARHTPSIAFRHPGTGKDAVNQCLEFGCINEGSRAWASEGQGLAAASVLH